MKFKFSDIKIGGYYRLSYKLFYIHGMTDKIGICKILSKNYEYRTVLVEGYTLADNKKVSYEITVDYIISKADDIDIKKFKMDVIRNDANNYNI